MKTTHIYSISHFTFLWCNFYFPLKISQICVFLYFRVSLHLIMNFQNTKCSPSIKWFTNNIANFHLSLTDLLHFCLMQSLFTFQHPTIIHFFQSSMLGYYVFDIKVTKETFSARLPHFQIKGFDFYLLNLFKTIIQQNKPWKSIFQISN